MIYGKRKQVQHPKRGDKKADRFGGFSRAFSTFKHVFETSDDANSPAVICAETNCPRDQQSAVEVWRSMFSSAVALVAMENLRSRMM